MPSRSDESLVFKCVVDASIYHSGLIQSRCLNVAYHSMHLSLHDGQKVHSWDHGTAHQGMQQRSVKCAAVASEHHMTRRALLPSMMRLLRQAHPELSFQTLQVLMHFMAAGDEDGIHSAAAQEPTAGAAAAVSAAAAAERAGLTEEQMESPAFVERVLHASHRLERRLPVRAV